MARVGRNGHENGGVSRSGGGVVACSRAGSRVDGLVKSDSGDVTGGLALGWSSNRSWSAVGGHAGWDERTGHNGRAGWAVGNLWATAGDGDLACAVKSLGDRNDSSWGGC